MASKDAKEAGASPASSGKLPPYKSFTAFVLSKHKYNLGDAVRVRGPSTNPADQFIGKITKIEARPGDNRNVMLTVKWYYRPDVRGRPPPPRALVGPTAAAHGRPGPLPFHPTAGNRGRPPAMARQGRAARLGPHGPHCRPIRQRAVPRAHL